MLIFFSCFLLLPTWNNSSWGEAMPEWWYWYMHISSSYWFPARNVSVSWQLCRWIRNANWETKFSIYKNWASVEYFCLLCLYLDLCEAWNCPSNSRICRTEVCKEIQEAPSHSNLSESARKPRRKRKKKKLSKVIIVSAVLYLQKSLWTWHNLWWFHQLHRLHMGRLLDIFWKYIKKNPHWYVKA